MVVFLQTKIKSCVSCFLTVSWDLCLRACRSKRTRQCPCMFLVAYEATLRALKGRLVNAKSPSWVRAEEVIGKNRTEKYHPRPRVIDLHFNQIIDFFCWCCCCWGCKESFVSNPHMSLANFMPYVFHKGSTQNTESK